MSREEWLEWRKPLFHVKNWLHDKRILRSDTDYIVPCNFNYITLKDIFTLPEFGWKEFNFPCVGSSEMFALMMQNDYLSATELYYTKVGAWEKPNIDSAAMFWGREHEAQIADKWQYWDGNQEGMIANFAAGKIIRKCRRLNAYAQNKKYPWIFVSADRIINKTETISEGLLECKTISGYAADQWEAGFPPYYIFQIQTAIGCIELAYGESAILKDGREMEVLPFDKSDTLFEAIITKSKAFYEDVKKGIEFYLLSLVAPDEETRAMNYACMERLSPEVDGSIAMSDFLKVKNHDKGYETTGKEEEYVWAKKYEDLKEKAKPFILEANRYANMLKDAMGEASTLTFTEDRGKVTWKENVKGSRVFKVFLK